MTRLIIALVIVAGTFASSPAYGQEVSGDASESALSLTHWVVAVEANSGVDPAASGARAIFAGVVPLRDLLPQTTPNSRIVFARVSAGMRMTDDEDRFSYDVTALDLSLQRAWWSGAVTLIDLASNTLYQHDRTWFEVGTGPGAHHTFSSGATSVAVQAFAGRRSTELFRPITDSGEGAGWHAGLRAMVSARFHDRMIISGRYSSTSFGTGDLSLEEATMEALAHLSDRWMASLRYQHVLNAPAAAMGGKNNPSQIGIQLGYVIN